MSKSKVKASIPRKKRMEAIHFVVDSTGANCLAKGMESA